MTDTPPPAYAVGDRVTVRTHYIWYGRDTYGHTGPVVGVVGELYDVDLDGFEDSPVPFEEKELGPADDRTGASS